MQQKILKLLVILMLVLIPKVNAECSYKEQAELNKEVANIKTNYEITTTKVIAASADDDSDIKEFDAEIFKINILNLSDKFYIKYSNNYNNDTKTYYPSDATNGVISFTWSDLSEVTTMTFKVYSSNKTGCANELYRTIYLTIPRYNQYHDWNICAGVNNSSLCDKYVTTDEISYSSFVEKLTSNISTNTNNGINTDGEISNENLYLYILSGIAIVVVISVTIILINRKRNRL